MAGIMDMFGGGDIYGDLLTEEQKQRMQQQTMMTMAAKLLQAGGPSTTPTSLGQALGGAFLSGQEAYGKAGQNAVQGMLTKQKIEEYRRANDYRKAVLGGPASAPTAASAAMTPNQALAVGGMPPGPTKQRAGMIGGAAPASKVSEQDKMYADLQRKYDLSNQYGMTDESKIYFDQMQKIRPTATVTGQPFQATDVSGKPVMLQQFNDGTIKTVIGYGPERKMSLQNLGGRVVAVDMNAVAPGSQMSTSMSPDASANFGLNRQKFDYQQGQDAKNFGLNQQKFDYQQGQNVLSNARADRQLDISAQSAENAGGGTVEERKAAMFVGRLANARQTMNSPVLGSDGKPLTEKNGKPVTLEDAFGKPGVTESMFRSSPVFGEVLANQASSSGRQQYRQAQEDWVTAIMRPESGAVIGIEEMQFKIATFFPQIGDSQAVIDQKKKSRDVSEQGLKTMAGRALKPTKDTEYNWVNGQLVPAN
jgi:hypothetical protein